MYQQFSAIFRRCTIIVVTILMAILVVLVVAGVFFRYVLGSSIPWSEELGRYVMIWVGFLGASLALREGSHVSVELFVQYFPQGPAGWLRGVVRGAIAGFLLVVIGYGILLVLHLWNQKSTVMGVRMTWAYLAIPVGSLLMLIQLTTPARQQSD